jgi:hypothetical protein
MISISELSTKEIAAREKTIKKIDSFPFIKVSYVLSNTAKHNWNLKAVLSAKIMLHAIEFQHNFAWLSLNTFHCLTSILSRYAKQFELELERGGKNLNPPDEEDYDSDLPSAVLLDEIEDMQLNVKDMSPIQD